MEPRAKGVEPVALEENKTVQKSIIYSSDWLSHNKMERRGGDERWGEERGERREEVREERRGERRGGRIGKEEGERRVGECKRRWEERRGEERRYLGVLAG